MKEIRRLRPGTAPEYYKEFQREVHATAFQLLQPCKDCGREHLANIIGRFVVEQHNALTLIAAGINERPKSGDEQKEFSTNAAVAGVLISAIIKMVEDPNTQWDDATLFYYQLKNHFENIDAASETALVREL